MIPVRTNRSNFVYRGPSPDIGDAWVERVPSERGVYLAWKPSEEERAYIAGGGLIRLGIHGMEPIPPVSLNVTDETELTAEGAALRDRARDELRKLAPTGAIPPGYWCVSTELWEQLNATGALDGHDDPSAVPSLWSRPLMHVSEPADHMHYVTGKEARPFA